MTSRKSKPKSPGRGFKTAEQVSHDHSLLTCESVDALSSLFKVLSNATRLRLLHALSLAEEMCVSDLVDAVEMKPQAVSNQLRQLSAGNIVGSRRDGLQVFYRIADPCVASVINYALCSTECRFADGGRGKEKT